MKNCIRVHTGGLAQVWRRAFWVMAAVCFPLAAAAAPSAKDGEGEMFASPTSALAASAGNSFVFSFRNGARGDYNTGSQLTLQVPAGWTEPQNLIPANPGYVSIASTSGIATASILSVTGAGPWTVTVNFTATKGVANGFNVGYAGGGGQIVAPITTGTYAFVAQTRQNGGVLTALSSSPAVVVRKGNQTIAFASIGDQLATNLVTLNAAASSGLAVVLAVVSGPGSLNGSELTFTGAGTVAVVASQSGDANWNPASAVTQIFSVAKAPATVSLGALSQTYDGTRRTVSAETVPSGLPLDLAYDGAATPPVAAGSYAVTAVINDALHQGSASGTLVVARAVAAVALDGLAQTYDGESKSATVTTEPAGLDLAITYDGSATLPVAAGSYAVFAEVRDPNYLGSVTGLLVLAKAAATVALDDLDQLYTGVPRRVDVITIPDDLDVEVMYNGDTMPPADPGQYAVAATVTDPNYSGSATGTLLVVPEVELEDLEQVYDGAPKTVRVKTKPVGMTATVTYDGQPTPPVNAGRYAVTAIVCHASECHGKVQGALNVSKASQRIDFASIGDRQATDMVGLSATAASGLAVEFLVADGPALISGGTNLAFSGTGTVSIAASQPGNGNWNAAPVAVRTFNVTNPGALTLELSTANVRVREGGEGRFFVRLNRPPTGNLPVNVVWDSGNADLTVKAGASLTFRPSNWSSWQAVTLVESEDPDAESETATFRISGTGLEDRLVAGTTLDDDIGENLALPLRGTTIAGTKAYLLPLAIDGVHTVGTSYAYTVWTNAQPGTMTLDLQDATPVARIRLLNYDWSYRSHGYRIDASSNGSDWSVLVDASTGEHMGWEDWPVAESSVRYLRFTGLSNSANSSVCIAEWEVYGPLGQSPRPECSATNVHVREAGEGRFFVRLDRAPVSNVVVAVACGSGNPDLSMKAGATLTFKPSNWSSWQAVTLAAVEDANAGNETSSIRISSAGVADRFLRAVVLDDDIGENLALASGGTTISGTKAYQLSQAIDGVHATGTNYAYAVWTNLSRPGTVTLDLQRTSAVSRVRLLNYDWSFRSHRYRIESSVNGAAWTLLADASSGDHRGWEDWAVSNAVIRYLRFTGLSNSANSAVCLSEWEVYGSRVQIQPSRPELAATNVNVREAGEGRFFVRLDQEPAGSITVKVSRCSGSLDLSAKSGTSLVFKPTNWNAWRAVTLEAADDANGDNETALFRVSAPGVADQFVEATALDDDIGDNLALASGGATISGAWTYRPTHLIDGVHNTSTNFGYLYWTNISAWTAITLDLHTTAAVSRVRLLNWDWSYRVQQYRIESSENGVNWSLLVDAGTGEHRGWEDWAVDGRPIRYLRFLAVSSSVGSYVNVSELEVYGTRLAPTRSLASANAGSRAESIPVTVLTSEGEEDETGWNAVDGDDETAWVGQKAGGGYVVIEYQPALELSALEVDLAEGSLTNIEYLYSTDAQNWQPLPDDLKSNPISLNYLWLVFPDDGTEAVPHVLEIVPNP